MHYSLKRAAAWNLSGYIYLIIASLISTPIFVKHLGFGVFAQYGLIIATLGLVSSINLGLPLAVSRLLTQKNSSSINKLSIWTTSSQIFITIGVVSGLVAVVISHWLQVDYNTLFVIFCIAVTSSLVTHYMTLPFAEGHFGYYNIKTFIVGSSNTLISAFLVANPNLIPQTILIHLGIVDILLRVQLFAYLITLLCLAYFSLKFFPRPRDGIFSKPIAVKLIKFGLKNQLGALVGQIQSQYGKYLLTSLSPLKLSAYIIATSLVQKIIGGVGQIATSLYPAASRGDSHEKLRVIYTKTQLILFILGIAGIIVYGYVGLPFLTWWLSDGAIASSVHSFLLVYRYYALLLLLTPIASAMMDGRGYPGTTSLFGLSAFILEFVIALLLLPSYEILAPAYAGLISLGIMTPLFLIFTGKILSHGERKTQTELS